MSDKILIIGLGSIGQRHARNALLLGCEVIGYDPAIRDRILRIGMMHSDREGLTIVPIEIVQSLEAGIACHPLGVIIATPPETHAKIGAALATAGVRYCLVEKPLATTAIDAEWICRNFGYPETTLAVGYQFRHIAALRRLKAQADAGEFGTIYAAHAEFASQKWCSHTYRADLLLECSHELDLLRWLLGDPREARGHKTHAGWQLSFKTYEWSATMSLDGIAPGYRRRFTIYGTKDIGEWTLDQAENDQAYVDELKDFLAVCRGYLPINRFKDGIAQPLCTGRDGWWVLRMVEAIRRSAESGRWEMI